MSPEIRFAQIRDDGAPRVSEDESMDAPIDTAPKAQVWRTGEPNET